MSPAAMEGLRPLRHGHALTGLGAVEVIDDQQVRAHLEGGDEESRRGAPISAHLSHSALAAR